MINKRRVVILGCGNVGSTIAYSLHVQNICDVMLMNHNSQKAISNVYDINDCIVDRSGYKVSYGGYNDVDSNDIIINCAGNSSMLKTRDRISEFENSTRIAADIINNLNKIGFKGIFINVMNPCDEVTWLFKDLDIPKTQIFGTGTMLETFRLQRVLYEQFQSPMKSYMIGNHGTHNNIVIKDDILFNQSDDFIQELIHKVQNRVWDIYAGKGFTNFGIANVVVKLVKDIINNYMIEECVCTLCADTIYHIKGPISVPCFISGLGIARIDYHIEVENTLNILSKEACI